MQATTISSYVNIRTIVCASERALVEALRQRDPFTSERPLEYTDDDRAWFRAPVKGSAS
jgi:hypothetical protein